jgi:hypothetical protein
MIKIESLPADILSRIPEVKRVLAEDKNIVLRKISELETYLKSFPDK